MWWFLFGYMYVSAGLAALGTVGRGQKLWWEAVATFLFAPLAIPSMIFVKLYEWFLDE